MNSSSKMLALLLLLVHPLGAEAQQNALNALLSDSSMVASSVSLSIIDTSTGDKLFEYEPVKSLAPASVLKLFTTAAALELLGRDYTFTTSLGYTGKLDKKTGTLYGDLIIKGGGDPALGSEYFSGHYGDFLSEWLSRISQTGIKRIEGKIITDDSRYDYHPVPPKWLWEDLGNYYGAGVYGLSVFDNTFRISFRTGNEGSVPSVTGFYPGICRYELLNLLISSGTTDKGYIFSAPYTETGWMAGSVPANRNEFILRGSVGDPPLLAARLLDMMLDSSGTEVTGAPTTFRLEKAAVKDYEMTLIAQTESPPLEKIVNVINHESVNLYAEHLLKELAKHTGKTGTTAAGLEVLMNFLKATGINTSGLFAEDGSGLSPLNAITSRSMAELLVHMRKRPDNSDSFYNSLPLAGTGTLKSSFNSPAISGRIRAKSGSMTRVRSYAGYITAQSGKEFAFCILVGNFSGSSRPIVAGIEKIVSETILNN